MPFKNLVALIDSFSEKCTTIASGGIQNTNTPLEKSNIRNIGISIYETLLNIVIKGQFTTEYDYKSLINKIENSYNKVEEAYFEEDNIEEILSPNDETEVSQTTSDFDLFEIQYLFEESKTAIIEWLEKTDKLSKIVCKDIINNDTTWINKDTSLLINEELYDFSSHIDLSSYYKTFNNIINLFYIDFNLNCSLDQLPKLSHIKIYLEKQEAIRTLDPDIRTALKCKVDYLIFKIIRANNRKHEDLKYSIDENIFSLNEDDYTRNIQNSRHYDILISNDNIRQKYAKIKNLSSSSFENYYIKTKYFKHDCKNNPKNSIESLSQLLTSFEDKCKPTLHTPFNNWAYERTYIFIYNNWLSLKFKSESIDDNTIKEIFDDTITKQSRFNVKNYYPFLKICTYIKNKIGESIQLELTNSSTTSTQDSNLPTIAKLMILLDDATIHLELCVKWSESHLNWAFQPDFESCTDTIKVSKDISIPIFNTSSFIVPINYNEVKNELAVIKENTKDFKSQIEILKTTNQLNQRLDIKIKELNQRLDGKMKEVDGFSKKNVEVLSVFAALVLFTIGNIQIFKEANSINDALLFMICFAYAIAIFVLLIRFITKESGSNNNTENKVLGILTAATIVVVSLLYRSGPQQFPSPKKEESININLSSPIPTNVPNAQLKQPSNLSNNSSERNRQFQKN